MRVFKDLGLVEYLGSGVLRILKVYPRDAFTFSRHFIRIAFPASKEALALECENAAAGRGLESGPESIRERVLLALAGSPLSKSGLAGTLGHKSASGKLTSGCVKCSRRG
jgi:predicted HTH transcriptional regulator